MFVEVFNDALIGCESKVTMLLILIILSSFDIMDINVIGALATRYIFITFLHHTKIKVEQFVQ